MAKNLVEQAIVEVLSEPYSADVRAPGLPTPRPGNPKAAVRRCCAAWQRSFDAYMNSNGRDASEHLASFHAEVAYRNAMPILAGSEGIRDYIACIAHGILIKAIPEDQRRPLLYAAQVALAALPKQRKSANSAASPTPHPLKKSMKGADISTELEHNQQDSETACLPVD